MAVSYLYSSGAMSVEDICSVYGREALAVINLLDRNINCIETSSMRRLFDAVSSILGVCNKISYEGQASMELEALVSGENSESHYPYSIDEQHGTFIFDPSNTIHEIVEDKYKGIDASIISRRFHNTVIKASVDICSRIRIKTEISDVALSGGVLQNSYLLENMTNELQKQGFTVHTHSSIPSNDGGVSLGQIVIANELIK